MDYIANLPPLPIVKNFKFFSKNSKFRTFLEILLFQSPSTANLQQSGDKKKFHGQNRRTSDTF